ncbi:MAG TPA: hypothetical protein VLI92_04510, partial [Candidatus Saccharimonadales bacterium]|nr:hypothetical protein [Candidatus Saccharimonadales bacterium]
MYADSSNPCNATGPGVSGWRWVATPHDCFGHTVNLCSLVQDTGCCPGGGSTCSDSDPSPSPLVLVSPANGSVVRGLTDVFDWNDVSGWGTNCGTQNNTYTIYIQKDGWSGAGAIVNGSSNRINSTTSSNYTHTVSQAGHVYYWQVEATNGARSVWSPVWSYTTDTVPYGTVGGPAKICVGQPGTYTTVIRDAQNNIKLTQIFRRLRTAANTAWEVGSSWILMNSKTCAPTSACDTTAAWTPLATDLGDIYRFAVNAYDSLDDGQNITDAAYSRCSGNTDPQTTWSRCDTSVPQNDYLDVTVGQSTAPIAPILLTPTNGSTNVILNPTFTWKAGLGADPFGSVCPGAETDTYHFQIRQCNILLNGTCSAWGAWQDKTAIPSTTLSTTSPIVLQQNTQYSWRVAANNGNAETWSQTANFWVFTTCGFTPPTAPTLKPTTFTSTTAHLSWNGILSTQWGGGCSALVKQYKVFIDSTASPAVATVNDGSPLVASYVGVRGTTHTWWVATYNGS